MISLELIQAQHGPAHVTQTLQKQQSKEKNKVIRMKKLRFAKVAVNCSLSYVNLRLLRAAWEYCVYSSSTIHLLV